jgi:hypothetical protein
MNSGHVGELTVSFQIANTGGSPARRITGDLHLLSTVAHNAEKIDLLHGDEGRFALDSLEPGQMHRYADALPTGTTNDQNWLDFYAGKDVPRHYLYLIGTVWYFDDLGIPRQTGLYRKFNASYSRFDPEKDHEQEYSD